jgi:multicomponent K+:H+ antiporter subunit F
VPLDLRDPFVATLLASVVSLTPGTVPSTSTSSAGFCSCMPSTHPIRRRWSRDQGALRAPTQGDVRMLNAAIEIAFVLIGAAQALNLYRLLRGPDTTDRILALDTLGINAIALLVLFGIRTGSTAYFEVALLLALLGFVGTVALCKFLLRGDIIE